MGIKNANKFATKTELPLTVLSKKRIAIDAMNWFCTYQSTSYKSVIERWKNPLEEIPKEIVFEKLVAHYVSFNNKFMGYKIIPVWIWDGQAKNNKFVTQVERRKKRKITSEKRDNLKKELLSMDILERPKNLLEDYKKLSCVTNFLGTDYIEKLKEISVKSGIPVFFAKDEAENLASSLAVERKVAAVWTSDTDTYPLGAPLVIKKFITKNNQLYIESVFTPKMLARLGMDHKEYRDFCILLGTDFNDNIPGIGPKGAMNLIKKYGNLENIEKETKHNLYSLHYKDVREQLTPYDTDYTDKDFEIKKEQILPKYDNKIYKDQVELFKAYSMYMPPTTSVPTN